MPGQKPDSAMAVPRNPHPEGTEALSPGTAKSHPCPSARAMPTAVCRAATAPDPTGAPQLPPCLGFRLRGVGEAAQSSTGEGGATVQTRARAGAAPGFAEAPGGLRLTPRLQSSTADLCSLPVQGGTVPSVRPAPLTGRDHSRGVGACLPACLPFCVPATWRVEVGTSHCRPARPWRPAPSSLYKRTLPGSCTPGQGSDSARGTDTHSECVRSAGFLKT